MPEYISREALLRTLSKEVGYNDDGDQDINSDTVFIAIESAPAADVEAVRHGKWKAKPNIYGVVYCSECGYELHTNDTHYCPNCGAKMDKEDET